MQIICSQCKKDYTEIHTDKSVSACCNAQLITVENNITTFKSGAIRDSQEGKELYCDTISWTAFRRYAQYMTGKRKRYKDGNFKLGISIESYEDSLVRHLVKYMTNKKENGDLEKDQDHLSAMVFNLFGIMHEEEKTKLQERERLS